MRVEPNTHIELRQSLGVTYSTLVSLKSVRHNIMNIELRRFPRPHLIMVQWCGSKNTHTHRLFGACILWILSLYDVDLVDLKQNMTNNALNEIGRLKSKESAGVIKDLNRRGNRYVYREPRAVSFPNRPFSRSSIGSSANSTDNPRSEKSITNTNPCSIAVSKDRRNCKDTSSSLSEFFKSRINSG